jgi:hypothetical protein
LYKIAMAYNKEELEKQILKAIEENELTFFNEIPLYIAPTLSTLYEWEFEKSEAIKNLLEQNKVRQKSKMRRKWRESDNPALQIAAFKLLADDEEMKKLTMTKVESSGPNGGSIQTESKHVVEFRNYAGTGDSSTVQ